MTDITVNDITNGSVVNGEWAGTGVFDKLLAAVNDNIMLQYDSGRIKGQDYATAYVGSLQSVLSQSIEYVMREKLTEAQVDGIIKENALKEAQLGVIAKELEIKNAQLAEMAVDKQLKEYQRDTLQVDQHNTNVKQQSVLDQQVALEQKQIAKIEYENSILLPDQHNENLKKQLMIDEQTKGSKTERILKDKQVAMLGLDNVMKTVNTTPESVYTPKYGA